jgi:hypothetical protein
MRVDGVWLRHSIDSLSSSFYVGVYTTAGSAVSERLIPSSEFAQALDQYKFHTYRIPPVTLTAGQTYIVSVRSASTGLVGLELIDFDTAAYGAALPGGTSCYSVSRSSGSGSFTTLSQSKHFSIGVRISGIDDGLLSWTPGSGTTGNTLKILVDPAAQGAGGVSGAVFAAPSVGSIVGPKIGEFTGEQFEASLESGQAVLKVPVTAFGGTGLLQSDQPVVLVRNSTDTTGIIPATIIQE